MYHDCLYSDTIQQYLGDTDPIVSDGDKNQQTLLVNHMEPSKDFVPRRLPYVRRMDHCRGYRHITLRILKKETHPV